jgi:hypothetical protein
MKVTYEEVLKSLRLEEKPKFIADRVLKVWSGGGIIIIKNDSRKIPTR